MPIVETLVATGRVFDRIIDPERTHELEDVIREGSFYGMQLFDQHALELYRAGIISRQRARSPPPRVPTTSRSSWTAAPPDRGQGRRRRAQSVDVTRGGARR